MIIEDGDRRILYVDCNTPPPPQTYFIELKHWARNKENLTAVGEFLKKRYESMSLMQRERMLGRSPDTIEKRSLIYNSKNGRVQNIMDNLDNISFGENNEFICFNEIPLEYYQKEFSSPLACRNAITRDLQSLGYVDILCESDRDSFRINNIRYIIYIKSERLIEENLKNPEYFRYIKNLIRQKYVKKTTSPALAAVETVCHNPNDVTSHQSVRPASQTVANDAFKYEESSTIAFSPPDDVTSHHPVSQNLETKLKNLESAWLLNKNDVSQVQTPNLKPKTLPSPPQKKKTKEKSKSNSHQIIPPNSQDFYKQFFNNQNNLSLKDFLIYVRENAPSLNPSGTQRLLDIRSQRIKD